MGGTMTAWGSTATGDLAMATGVTMMVMGGMMMASGSTATGGTTTGGTMMARGSGAAGQRGSTAA